MLILFSEVVLSWINNVSVDFTVDLIILTVIKVYIIFTGYRKLTRNLLKRHRIQNFLTSMKN